MNKKCFIDNIYLLVVFILTFFVVIVVGFIFTQLNDKFDTLILFNDTKVQETITNVENSNANNDNLTFMLFFGMIIALLVSLYFLRSNPVFFVIGLIGLVLVVVFAIILRGAFTDVINSNPVFITEASNNPKSSFIFEYLPVILLVILSVFLIFMYINRGQVGVIQ